MTEIWHDYINRLEFVKTEEFNQIDKRISHLSKGLKFFLGNDLWINLVYLCKDGKTIVVMIFDAYCSKNMIGFDTNIFDGYYLADDGFNGWLKTNKLKI